jgi:ABC-type transporter Mla subunit MlaD
VKRNVSHFKVGLFVLLGLFLALGGLVWIGTAHLLESRKTYVTFFDQSVQNLVPGAEINYLGVKVGRVASVGLAPDEEYVRVLMAIRRDFEIDPSMAAELETNPLTGSSHLALVRLSKEEQEKTPSFDFPVRYPVVPSRAGGFQNVTKDLSRIVKKLESTDLEGLVNAWKATGREADGLLAGKALQESLQNVRQASADLRDLVASVGRPWTKQEVRAVFEDVAASAASVRNSSRSLAAQLDAIPPGTLGDIAEKADRVAGGGQEAVDTLSGQARDSLVLLRQSLYELNQVLSNLNRLVASLREEPSEILSRERERDAFGRK